MVPPDAFIPLAEQSGLVKPLTAWVLDAALRQSHAWRGRGLSIPVAVNLSTRSLLDPRLPETVAELLAARGVPAPWLTLEITESAIMADANAAAGILERLAADGIELALDDFGTGYSSMSSLRRLPVTELKIDRAFVMGMDRSEDDATIVRSIVELAHGLGMRAVAEGIETRATYDRLVKLGCDVGQGYLIARPMPAEEALRWLDARRVALVPNS